MATVIKLCNQLQKHKEKPEIAAYLEQFETEWQTLVSGELLKSNTTNNRSLGGQQPRSNAADDDDDSNSYEVNMERIMAKFTNFNSSQSQDASQDDDDEEEEEDKAEEFTGHQEEDDAPDFSHLED